MKQNLYFYKTVTIDKHDILYSENSYTTKPNWQPNKTINYTLPPFSMNVIPNSFSDIWTLLGNTDDINSLNLNNDIITNYNDLLLDSQAPRMSGLTDLTIASRDAYTEMTTHVNKFMSDYSSLDFQEYNFNIDLKYEYNDINNNKYSYIVRIVICRNTLI